MRFCVTFCTALVLVTGALSGNKERREPSRPKDIAEGPLNDARLISQSATLQCQATDTTSWISWAEYASGNPNGTPISDGEDVLEGNPNAERYTILHDGATRYDLYINSTILGDGGKYRCADINIPGAVAYAELIMLNSDPVCTTTVPSSGIVNEYEEYTASCSVDYRGNVAPIMTWSGPEPYEVQTSTSNETVSSKLTFTASRSMTGGQFLCKTNFTTDGFSAADSASNAPTYQHVYTGYTLNVYSSTGYGSVAYIRWGRTVCGSTTEVVYKGYAAGTRYNVPDGSSEYLCLPETPQWGYVSGVSSSRSNLTGVEYEIHSGSDQPFSFENNDGLSVVNHNMPCAVCLASNRTTQLMIPAAIDCPARWTKEYQGYLMSEFTGATNHFRSSYICVDEAPEIVAGESASDNPAVICPVEVTCHGIPCPSYVEGYEIACVVCTK